MKVPSYILTNCSAVTALTAEFLLLTTATIASTQIFPNVPSAAGSESLNSRDANPMSNPVAPSFSDP